MPYENSEQWVFNDKVNDLLFSSDIFLLSPTWHVHSRACKPSH